MSRSPSCVRFAVFVLLLPRRFRGIRLLLFPVLSQNPLYRFFVDEEDGKTAGYAGMFLALDEGNIANVAVFPEYRRKGIGEALVSALLACGYEEALTRMFLEVREGNTPAIALYRKLGFTETGYRRDYYHDPEEGARIFTRIL